MKNVIIKSLFLIGLLSFAPACTEDFEEINTNPNAPVAVNNALLLPQIARDMVNSVMNESWGIGNIVVQHTAKNQFVNEDRYLWGEINSIWNNVYDNMRDLRIVIDQSAAAGEKNYEGIGLVMKSWMFSLATDAYGDIPYLEATRAKEGINYPVYDTQESIYNGILADLKRANEILGTSGEIVGGDLIFRGDVQKWRKLANSLRIRYLMRISRVKNVAADLAAIVNNPAQNPIFESNADGAVYSYLSASPDQFPLHSARIGSFNEFRASRTLLDQLVALNDARLRVFFRPTPATESAATPVFVGLPNGLNDVDALQFNGGPQNQSRVSPLFYEQAVSAQGLQVAKGIIMTYAELQFLLAEAAEKGFIDSKNAETYYLNGVRGSFGFYGLTPTAEYLSQPAVAYTGTQAEKLTKIGTQKWISLFYQGLEAWFDWRRTGIPTITPGPGNQNENRVPVRFIYPIIEQSLNEANYKAAVARQGVDNINTKMWYLK